MALKKKPYTERSKVLEQFKESLEQDELWKRKIIARLRQLKTMEMKGKTTEARKEIILNLFNEYETLIEDLSAEYSLPILLRNKIREPVFEQRDFTQYAILGFINALSSYEAKKHGSFVDFVANEMKLAMDRARKLTRNVAPIAKVQDLADQFPENINPNWLDDIKVSQILSKTEYKLVMMKVKGQKIKAIAKYFKKSTPWVSKTYAKIIVKLKAASEKNPSLFQIKES